MREFLFYYYDLYSVFDWHETGKFNNRQLDGASYRTYRPNVSVIGCAIVGRSGTNVLEPIFYVLLSPPPADNLAAGSKGQVPPTRSTL